ncbi:Mce associated membrane protein [Mycobacterium heckeshornense]|uniref:mammalian cell entry protein n=1 Tax=Mycobacterium heckeshornense TaxID=110505 RepID=UPI0019438862|nr:mammalian cell entry protein [Mycobacterium heckeshornense]BCQ07935.1 Mce associated membrane protein [Mycobacterium heckeshornense]
MADDAQDAELSGSTMDDKPDGVGAAAFAGQGPPSGWATPAERWALVAGLTVVVVLGALVGWLGFRAYESHTAEVQRNVFLEVARQSAVNLTTFDYQHVDADVQRILGSATGSFYDKFSHRSRSFVDTVKRSQSKSAGTVTEAGVESQTRDEGQVLVAVTVKTVNSGGAEQERQAFRMRITVIKMGDGGKVSNVAFLS